MVGLSSTRRCIWPTKREAKRRITLLCFEASIFLYLALLRLIQFMYKKLFSLEWKAFLRSASFTQNLVVKIIMLLFAMLMASLFLLSGIGFYFIVSKEYGLDPVQVANQYLVYYLFADLLSRYFLQKNPAMLVRPFINLPIPRKILINFTLGKTMYSIFNLVHLFFLVPFTIILLLQQYPPLQVLAWFCAVMALVYCNNFLNILVNKKDSVFYTALAVVVVLGGLQIYGYFDITQYSGVMFQQMYNQVYWAAVPVLLLVLLYRLCFSFFAKNIYLDAGLANVVKRGSTEHYTWLDRFGSLGTFLKNDIRLIRRNKRSKTAVLTSVMFLLYGLLFFTGVSETYEGPVWRIFASIFVTGGFLFTFGQFVPSWDSSYYPLMMSQNIRYREYLSAKWWLIVIATIASTILASFYLYFGVDVYLAIVAGAIYNIGVNAHIVLWGGAYIKTPIDLASAKNAFGDKQAFNAKTLLLSLPKLLLPLLVFALGNYLFNVRVGYAFVIGAGIIGFGFRNRVFSQIEKVYKREKYLTINAYKQKN